MGSSCPTLEFQNDPGGRRLHKWSTARAYAKKEIPPLEPGAMSYMMSKDAYLTHLGHTHNLCHVMFFLPTKAGELGDNDPNSPISSTSIWFPDPDKPDSPLNKELSPLRTVPIAVPY